MAPALCAPAFASASGGAQASVIGGAPATIEQFPSLAYVEGGNGKHGFSCTGTVVAPRVVLTAGHCVEDLETGRFTKPAEYKVAIGVANPTLAQPENVFDVVATHVFPGFDPGLVHGDAAVLILSRPTSAPPLALAGPGDAGLYAGGAPVTVAGWGLTRPQNRQIPANLQSAPMVVQKGSTCGRRVRSYYTGFSPAAQLCLQNPPANKTGTCFGDSGGPAIGTRADGVPVQLGVISVVGPDCTTKIPNVLTRVDFVSAWATEWIAATEAGGPPPAASSLLPSMSEAGRRAVRALHPARSLRQALRRGRQTLRQLPAREQDQLPLRNRLDRPPHRLRRHRLPLLRQPPTDDHLGQPLPGPLGAPALPQERIPRPRLQHPQQTRLTTPRPNR